MAYSPEPSNLGISEWSGMSGWRSSSWQIAEVMLSVPRGSYSSGR
jgi:hypothetical protein